MRHLPFTVGPLERDRWLAHMAAAVAEACSGDENAARSEGGPDDLAEIAAELMGYFAPAAEHLRNDTGLPITSSHFEQH
jgi:hemoglobin